MLWLESSTWRITAKHASATAKFVSGPAIATIAIPSFGRLESTFGSTGHRPRPAERQAGRERRDDEHQRPEGIDVHERVEGSLPS